LRNTIIHELLSYLDEVLTRLEERRSVTLEEYVADWDIQQVIERGLHRSIQACIDIGARIIAQQDFRHAEGYHEIFDILASEGVIPFSFLPRIHEMIGLRNALVHEYRRIEHSEVFRHLQESLPILREFANYVRCFYQRFDSTNKKDRKEIW